MSNCMFVTAKHAKADSFDQSKLNLTVGKEASPDSVKAFGPDEISFKLVRQLRLVKHSPTSNGCEHVQQPKESFCKAAS